MKKFSRDCVFKYLVLTIIFGILLCLSMVAFVGMYGYASIKEKFDNINIIKTEKFVQLWLIISAISTFVNMIIFCILLSVYRILNNLDYNILE